MYRLGYREMPDHSEQQHQKLARCFLCASCEVLSLRRRITGSLSTGKFGGHYGYSACRNSKGRTAKFRHLDPHMKFLDLLSSLKLKPEMAQPSMRR